MNATEKQVREMLEARGFTVLRNGWPDFLCIRPHRNHGTTYAWDVMGVEVKTNGDKVSRDQAAMHTALRSARIPVFVVGPDTNFYQLTTGAFSTVRQLRRYFQQLQHQIGYLQGELEKLYQQEPSVAERAARAAFYGRSPDDDDG